jgi:hypothetical protein
MKYFVEVSTLIQQNLFFFFFSKLFSRNVTYKAVYPEQEFSTKWFVQWL